MMGLGMIRSLRSLPLWVKLAAGGGLGYFGYKKFVEPKAGKALPPGFQGALPAGTAAKVAATINRTQIPAVLRQLGDGLSKAGAPIAAKEAHEKADQIEQGQAPFARTIEELQRSGPTTLADVIAPVARDIAAVVPPIIPKTIRMGDRGVEVLQLQGLLSITADGIFGPQTKAAVVAYQKRKGLSADGVVGPQTWSALLSGK